MTVPVQGDPTREWLSRRNIEEFLLRLEEKNKMESEARPSVGSVGDEEDEEEELRPVKRPRIGLGEGAFST